MSYTNIIKSLPFYGLFGFIERRPSPTGSFTDSHGSYNKVEHYLYITKSGALLDIQPQTGVVRKVISNSYSLSADNYYPLAIYGWKGNKLLIHDGETNRATPNVTIYDPETGEIDFIDMVKYLGRYDMFTTGAGAVPFYRVLISSDGHIMGSNFRHYAAASTWRYNTTTKELEFFKADALPLFFQRHSVRVSPAIKITTTSENLNGVYHACWWDDIGNMIFNTVASEVIDAGFLLKGSTRFYIHDSDRALNSPTRRIIAIISKGGSTAWYIIDIKNPSVFYKASYGITEGADIYSNLTVTTWRDVSNNIIDTSGWSKGSLINEPFKSETTIIKPTYDGNMFYSNSRVVGRFGYSSGYVANKVYTFTLPIALEDYDNYTKGDIIIPSNWTPIDYGSSFYNNGSTINVYECNFHGQYGFSNENEYVGFINHPTTLLQGFISPETLEFITYNPLLNGNKYVNGGAIVRGPINMDLGEFGCYYNDQTQISNTILIEGDEYFYDHVFNQMQSVLKKDSILKIDQFNEVCDISFVVIPNKNKPWQKYTMGVSNVPTTTGNILNTTEMAENLLIFAGITYSGIILKQRQVNDSLVTLYSWGDNISYKGSLRIDDNRILFYGYMSRMDLINLSDLNNLVNSQTKLSVNTVIPEVSYASIYTDNLIFISGSLPRTANYMGGFGGFGYTNLTTKTSFTFPNIPVEFRLGTGQSVRSQAKLTASTYTDQEVETKFNEYLTTYNLTRNQGISNFLNTVSWTSQGIESYSDNSGKFIISLRWNGISALSGIRINEVTDRSGLWITDNVTPGTKVGTTDVNIYPKVIYVNKADKNLTTLQSSDYKTVAFTDLLNKITAGRLVITDDYITFLDHDATNSRAIVRVISKVNFENAANGSGLATFDSTIYIPLNSTSTKYGFGSQGGDYDFFSINGTPRNPYFAVDNYIFVTLSSNTAVPGSSLFPAVIRIDVANNTYSNWCIDTVKQAAKGLTFNPTTGTALFTRDTTTFRIPNFTSLTPPYTLI